MESARDRIASAGAMVGLVGLVNLGVSVVIEERLASRFESDFGHPSWAAMTFLVETTQPYLVVGACLIACAALVPFASDGEPRGLALGWAVPVSVVVSMLFELAMYRYVAPLLETWGYRELTVLERVARGAACGLVLSALPVGVVVGSSAQRRRQRQRQAAVHDVGRRGELRRRAVSISCAALGLLVAPLTLLTYRVDRDHRSFALAFPFAVLLAVGVPLAGLVANGLAVARRR